MRTVRERVREWERWHDWAKGCYEMAQGVGGPDGADGMSWDGMAANRLGRRISVNRPGGVLT